MVTYTTSSTSTSLPSTNPAPSLPNPRSTRRRGLSYLRNYTHINSSASSAADPHVAAESRPRPRLQPRHSLFRSSSSTADEQVRVRNPVRPWSASQNGRSRSSRSDSDKQAVTVAGQAAINTALVGISRLMARNRAGSTQQTSPPGAGTAPSNLSGYPQDQMPTIRLIPHQDPRSSRPSLDFSPMSRTLPHEECVISVGRYSERDSNPQPPPNTPSSAPVGFKSKVVSRRHCEFWCSNGQWYIKDVKSSSGTFLNHIRLSQPSVESRPFPVNDGDVVQLGIDFRGGEEMIFRCVKIRVECNRAWQKSLNNFNVSTHKRLRNLAKSGTNQDPDAASTHSSECSICLMSVAPCQSLFVAPCSHVWHYKCIRPILNDHKTWPQFLCPNCRAIADLEADVDDLDDEVWEDDENGGDMESNNPNTNRVNEQSTNIMIPAVSENHSLAASSQIDLPIRGRVDGPSDSNLAPSFPTPADQMEHPSTMSNIISRRNASHTTLQITNSDLFGSTPRDTNQQNPNTGDHLRPVTPTNALRENMDTPPNGSPSVEEVTEYLAAYGPMTPTNNAGPFVFDGSAGRTSNR